MFHGRISSWNLRDAHMTDTLDSLLSFLTLNLKHPAKVVVWEHNSHLGDARATQMGEEGEFNVGQLVRERHGANAVLIGLTTHHGTVTAASNWDAPAERKQVRPALDQSFEALFHDVAIPRFLLTFRNSEHATAALRERLLERAIGVIYRPETERASHYFRASLSKQFDAVVHFDETRAVEPLERTVEWERGEVPETFPTGI
jgi:erythromycin esterase-like protein